MTVMTTYKGEEFLVHSEVLMKAIEMVSKKPLTPLRVSKIRHSLENEWVNINIKYQQGGGYFSDEMCEYYIHKAFECAFSTTPN